LTVVEKEEDISDNSEDTETKVDRKLREAWDNISKLATRNKSNIEITSIKDRKLQRVICIKVPDSDKESEDDKSTELDNKKQVL
jgi:hypothetical protein